MNTEQSRIVSNVINQHRQQSSPVKNNFCGHTFTTFPGVFSPFLAPSGHLTFCFASLPIFSGKRVLDIGCGSGLIACVAALSGAAKVIGVDINPTAIENAQFNSRQLKVEAKTQFFHGDLFEPVSQEEQFDLIFANLPFAIGEPKDLLEASFFDPDLSSIRRYIKGVGLWLKSKHSRAYLCISDLESYDLPTLAINAGLGWDKYITIDEGWINLSIVEL